MTNRTLLRSGHVAAAVAPRGAELCSLRNASGQELMWQAGPSWPRHAPLLFPVIGRMVEDTLLHNGVGHPMPQHGFARDLDFSRISVTETSAHFRLIDTAESRTHFPFAFALDVFYELSDDALSIGYKVGNPDPEVILPASLGVHPAFRWPLGAHNKSRHRLEFNAVEDRPIRQVDDVLLQDARCPSPIAESSLVLDPALFADGALILDRLSSTSVRYETTEGAGISLSWSGFEHLAIWSPPDGTDLLCIEPWAGLPSPVDFVGEYRDKPAQFHVPPWEHKDFTLQISGLSCPPRRSLSAPAAMSATPTQDAP